MTLEKRRRTIPIPEQRTGATAYVMINRDTGEIAQCIDAISLLDLALPALSDGQEIVLTVSDHPPRPTPEGERMRASIQELIADQLRSDIKLLDSKTQDLEDAQEEVRQKQETIALLNARISDSRHELRDSVDWDQNGEVRTGKRSEPAK